MAVSKKQQINLKENAPETLTSHPFYGFILDENQKEFRDAIWNKDTPIVFCNACAGSGKTTITTMVANLLVQYGRYCGIVYCVSSYGESKQGFLPGDITEKSEVYFEPFYQAAEKADINMNMALIHDSMIENQKNGTAYIKCLTHTYLRGTNFENQVVILDEAQNYSVEDLKKTLTRCSDNCKVVVIGHDGQCDLDDKQSSGFNKYLKHFAKDSRCAVCKLTHNYRGWISQYADELN